MRRTSCVSPVSGNSRFLFSLRGTTGSSKINGPESAVAALLDDDVVVSCLRQKNHMRRTSCCEPNTKKNAMLTINAKI